ncbi:hypothetical protein E3N88_35809 [Mikania micrantha]|uniref:ethanolamine kinase n=1 Tax=Mikania micrantha TaxID=192012 RepID=A0A5N6M1Z3_9ASTR|nr:hypothetical protein E3N88_35809 [Mikania micrantha]
MAVSVEARNIQIPYSSLTVDHTLPIPEMKPSLVYALFQFCFFFLLMYSTRFELILIMKRIMKKLCKDLFTKWSNLDESHFFAERVSGGITNLLLKVSVKEQNGNMVHITVRLYGPNTEYVINRERELQAIHYLSAAGFGAKLLGVFGNGMVQSFIHARTFEPLDFRKPKLAAEIAKQLHRFHQVEIPGSKEPQLWVDTFKFFERASTLTFDDHEKQARYDAISFEEVHTELIKLKELTGRLDAPVVFAHNDLLSGNVMLNEDEEKLYIIDFEYASYSYRGFDIGNHFNEYAGYDCDYTL